MATTTTNFGWDIPQSTDLVKDGATAIAALGQDIDTALVDLKGGTTGQVLAKASGTDLDFSWVAQDDSNAIQNAIVDAKGDLITATAADTPARLAVGTNGHALVADSTTATGLKWAAVGGGKIAQVVQGLKTDTSTTTSQSFVASGITLTITPSANTSKILIMSTISISGSASTQPMFKLRRDNTTDLLVGDAASSRTRATGQSFVSNSNFTAQGNVVYLDSPATTSAITYEIYWRSAEGPTVAINRSVTDNDGSDYGARLASSIIAMEVLA